MFKVGDRIKSTVSGRIGTVKRADYDVYKELTIQWDNGKIVERKAVEDKFILINEPNDILKVMCSK
jgi:hypothetical protein